MHKSHPISHPISNTISSLHLLYYLQLIGPPVIGSGSVFIERSFYIVAPTINYQESPTPIKLWKQSTDNITPHLLYYLQLFGLLFVGGGSVFIESRLHCNYNHQFSRSHYNMHKESATTSAQSPKVTMPPCRQDMCRLEAPTRHRPHPTLTLADIASNKRCHKLN
jgi:hypothetical protein